MNVRPALVHERLAAMSKEHLETALRGDLTSMKRADLTLLRLELDASKRLQMATGQVASWEDWRAAFVRVEAEIATRPVPTRRWTR